MEILSAGALAYIFTFIFVGSPFHPNDKFSKRGFFFDLFMMFVCTGVLIVGLVVGNLVFVWENHQ